MRALRVKICCPRKKFRSENLAAFNYVRDYVMTSRAAQCRMQLRVFVIRQSLSKI
jgi:hypothetical protein